VRLFNLKHSRNLVLPDTYINIGHFLDHFMMLIFAKSAFDAGREFGLTYDEIIVYGTLGMFLFGAASPLAGWLADKYSRSIIITIYPFGVGLGSLMCFFSSSPFMLGISLGIIGFFAAIFHPVGIAMLIRNTDKVGFRLGINGVWGNMGVAAAPVLTGFLIVYSDWRTGFLVPAIICLVFGVIQFYGFIELKINQAQKKESKFEKSSFADGWKIVLSSLTMTTLAGGFVFGSLTFLIPRLFEVNLNGITTDIAITGLLAGLVYAIASFSQIGVGLLIDRFPPKYVLAIMGLGQFILIYISSFYFDYILLFVILMAMLFVFGQVPITDAILVRYIDDKWRARVLSVKFLINLCAGASVLPLTSIFLKSGFSFNDLLKVLSILAVFVIISALILPNEKKLKLKTT
jgi:MFS family permease|tara:strand:- start:4309 stop:5517 length:1209 start_codon:yes stop_codon:yes gene_type:complete